MLNNSTLTVCRLHLSISTFIAFLPFRAVYRESYRFEHIAQYCRLILEYLEYFNSNFKTFSSVSSVSRSVWLLVSKCGAFHSGKMLVAKLADQLVLVKYLCSVSDAIGET